MVCGVCSPNFASPPAMAMPGSASDAAEIVFASFLVMVTELGAESTQSVVPASFKFLYAIEGDCEVLAYAVKLCVNYSDRLARRTFRYSIVYLSCFFAVLLIDHWRLG